jgi:hypothetical protein
MNCLFKMAIVMLLRIIIFILLEIKDQINQPYVGDGNLEVHFIFYFIFQIPIYIYISMSHPLSYLIICNCHGLVILSMMGKMGGGMGDYLYVN